MYQYFIKQFFKLLDYLKTFILKQNNSVIEPEVLFLKHSQSTHYPEVSFPRTEQKYSLPRGIIPQNRTKVLTTRKYHSPKQNKSTHYLEVSFPKTEQKYSLPRGIIPKNGTQLLCFGNRTSGTITELFSYGIKTFSSNSIVSKNIQ